jgi:hypothetical protein
MTGLTLITRGYIDELNEDVVSCKRPEVKNVMEVRPKVRTARASETAVVASPVITSSDELKPGLQAVVPPPFSSDVVPENTSLTELRPSIKKAEKE